MELTPPTAEDIQAACEMALGYKPTVVKHVKSVAQKPKYFGIQPDTESSDLERIISAALENAPQEEGMKVFWEELKKKKRVADRPHITIVHSKAIDEAKDLWERCSVLDNMVTLPPFTYRLGELISNGEVMALTVTDLGVVDDGQGGLGAAKSYLKELPEAVLNRLHITVGTESDNTAAFEAGRMVEKWKYGSKDASIRVLPLGDIHGQGRLRAFFF